MAIINKQAGGSIMKMSEKAKKSAKGKQRKHGEERHIMKSMAKMADGGVNRNRHNGTLL